MRHLTRAVLAAVVVTFAFTGTASAVVPANADHYEFYIADSLPYPAGEPTLHADLLVPKGTDITKTKLPTIVSVGPYFAYLASAVTDVEPTNPGPKLRWNDLIKDGRLFERGYALLQVDLRGFGASEGCNDFGGRGEQLDVKRAIEWAVKQPWSNGKTTIYGKSYDGWTGVMALDEKPKGLTAAVIQSPIIDGYRTLYQDGQHYGPGWYITPALYQAIDATPPSAGVVTSGNAEYAVGWARGTDPACWAKNIALQNGLQDRNDAAGFWKERDLDGARGSDVATFWTHGFLDVNTKPDNFESVWSTLTGPKRAWFGQFQHTRPNEPGVGRHEYFFDEMFDFLDEHMKGEEPVEAVQVEVEDNEGVWRGEDAWPPADATPHAIALRKGSYSDVPRNPGESWSITPPLAHDARIAGVPMASIGVTTSVPRANINVNLWDIDDSGYAELIARGAGIIRGTGASKKSVELFPADHIVRAGHQIGVQIVPTSNLFTPAHTAQTVTIGGGSLTAPFLRFERTAFLPGGASSDGNARQRMNVPSSTIENSTTTWDAPPAPAPRP